MHRDITGRYGAGTAGGEMVNVPNPLPPVPPLELTGAGQRLLDRATLAVVRIDSVTCCYLTRSSTST